MWGRVNIVLAMVLSKFTNRLNWTYANIKVFSKPYFPVYGQNPRIYTGKCISEKTLIFAFFIQGDIFHLLAQKRTHD